MANVFNKWSAFLLVLMSLQYSVADAQTLKSPVVPANTETLKVHDQAEEIYNRTEYERAFFIYRNELAAVGDKYGQYMVGYMYLSGKGVPEDRVAASAWYRLAAERDVLEFARARDRLMAVLTAEEKARSDQMFVDLRKQYSDLALLMREIRKDYAMLRSHNRTQLPFNRATQVIVIRPGRSPGTQSADYYGQIERRIRARLKYIASRTEIEFASGNINTVDLSSIDQQLQAHLETLD